MQTILFFLSVVLIAACTKKQPAYANEEVKQLLLSANCRRQHFFTQTKEFEGKFKKTGVSEIETKA